MWCVSHWVLTIDTKGKAECINQQCRRVSGYDPKGTWQKHRQVALPHNLLQHHSPPPLHSILSLSFPSLSCLFHLPVSYVLLLSLPWWHYCWGVGVGGQMLSDGLTSWYGHRYTGSDMDSKSCRFACGQTCSHKMSKKRERGNQPWGRTGQLADLTCWWAFPAEERQTKRLWLSRSKTFETWSRYA